MRLLLTQPAIRGDDGLNDLAGFVRLVETSDIEPRADDVLILPELVGGDAPRAASTHAS